jgi:drug/metabolite transporter (DMT)-like permease
MQTTSSNKPKVNMRLVINWVIFLALCLIWGSSFILMKLGLFNTTGSPLLTAYQVASLRMLSAGLVLLPFATAAFKRLPDAPTRKFVFLSGLLGSFFPAYLFCMAETKIDSSLAGAINAMTPLSVLLVGTLVYKSIIPANKWIGIVVGFTGCLLLFVNNAGNIQASSGYALLAVLATIFYGINVNMVKHRLQHAASVDIAAMAFVFLIIPSFLVLLSTGYFALPLSNKEMMLATTSSVVLGILGTALASILFYMLVKRTGIVFPSLVTYGIPFVAIGWGVFYGEKISAMQIIALLIILTGVYLANMQMAEGWRKAKKMLLRKQQHP